MNLGGGAGVLHDMDPEKRKLRQTKRAVKRADPPRSKLKPEPGPDPSSGPVK